jgi:Ser/Thr protein kinase RdoA (MazF antagonist)
VQGPDSAAVARRIAYALAKLHNSNLNPSSQHTIDSELAILEERLPAAADQVPHLADRVLALLDTCRRIAAQHRPGELCPVHRDFYPDQVLVDGERIVLLDFDLLRSGEAAVDVGNLRAHLTEHALRYPEHKHAYAVFDAAFVAEYAQLRPSVTPDQIGVYTFLSLARHVSLCISKPSHHASMLRLLDACEQQLRDGTLTNGTAIASSADALAN